MDLFTLQINYVIDWHLRNAWVVQIMQLQSAQNVVNFSVQIVLQKLAPVAVAENSSGFDSSGFYNEEFLFLHFFNKTYSYARITKR